ncbi:hypothetical protein KKG29_02370 [Patescibacteria group bacterium]|nr:hypothetical protein [Patescibacteria group bacterium]MBU4000002.1 hypothetical protein [Patescibacteria group bacterium]MBU4056720.1 hypothetical protein [Patescibacteria group bacterium]
MKKILILISIFGLIGLISGLGIQVVRAVSTALDVTMTAGSLSISNSTAATASYTGKTVSITEQTDTATIGNTTYTDTTGIEVTDTRGTGAGWSAVMTVTHLNTKATQKTLAGSNNTVTFTGTYDGLDGVLDPNGTFKVEITTGGAVGTAVFKWWDPAANLTSTVTTAASVVLSNGITVNFAAATYVVADSWSAGVDVFPYNYSTTKGLTATPSTIHNASGSLTGVTAGSAELMTGSAATSNAKTVMTAAVNRGFGDYFIDVGLSQTIHPNSLSGSYTSTAVITVS